MKRKNRKPPVDKKKAAFYTLLAAGVVVGLIPLMVFIHEMGHVIATLLLGGTVSGLHISWSGGHVSCSGIESSRGLFLVHISGVLATTSLGAYFIFRVWKYEDHPFVEAVTLLWGIMLFLTDFITYSISDIFSEHGGDISKIYDSYPWSIPLFILTDLILLGTALFVLTRRGFWKRIQLPRKV